MKILLIFIIGITLWIVLSSKALMFLGVGWPFMGMIYTVCWYIYKWWIRPQTLDALNYGVACFPVFGIIWLLTWYVVPDEVREDPLCFQLITAIIFMMPFLIVPSLFKMVFPKLKKLKFW